MLATNQIHLGDCLEVMNDIDDGAVDMILCDLPYGTTACDFDKRVKRAGLNLIIKAIEALKVNPLLVAALRALTVELYELPINPLDLWPHFKRIIKPNGAVVMTASQPFTSVLVMSNLAWFKCEWVWEKDVHSNFANAKYHPLKYHESVLVFSKDSVDYHPQIFRDKRPSNHSGSFVGKRDGMSNTIFKPQERQKSYERFPKSIIKFNTPKHNDSDNGSLHPTQKPVALFAYLIRTYSNPGGLILDPTAGSATTAIAAIDTGRNWLCIEKDEGYYNLAKERIEERLLQPFLPEIVERPKERAEQLSLV